MSAKVVRTIAISGVTGEVLEAPVAAPVMCDEIDATTFADAKKAFVAHPQGEDDVITVKVAGVTVPAAGSAVSYSATVTFTDNTTSTYTVAGFVKSAKPSTAVVGGDRVAAVDIEIRPNGGGTTTTAAPTTTTAAATTTTPG